MWHETSHTGIFFFEAVNLVSSTIVIFGIYFDCIILDRRWRSRILVRRLDYSEPQLAVGALIEAKEGAAGPKGGEIILQESPPTSFDWIFGSEIGATHAVLEQPRPTTPMRIY
eukprot:SAG11_NODE_5610_length_1509_cov_0.736879_1_plen_113_part_00